jgi:hypothetical protein
MTTTRVAPPAARGLAMDRAPFGRIFQPGSPPLEESW